MTAQQIYAEIDGDQLEILWQIAHGGMTWGHYVDDETTGADFLWCAAQLLCRETVNGVLILTPLGKSVLELDDADALEPFDF